jgi:hypothetical protein
VEISPKILTLNCRVNILGNQGKVYNIICWSEASTAINLYTLWCDNGQGIGKGEPRTLKSAPYTEVLFSVYARSLQQRSTLEVWTTAFPL